MVLSRRMISRIEWHFLHASEDADELERLRTEIAEAPRPLDPAGSHGSTPGDPTGRAVVAIEARTAVLECWLQVVADTYRRFRTEPADTLMNFLYAERMTIRRAAKAMHVSAATAYNWRADVLTYAALKGAERGMVRV